MTIRYNIKLDNERRASRSAVSYDSLDGVTIVSVSLDTLRIDIDEDDQAWFETVLDKDESVVSYSAH